MNILMPPAFTKPPFRKDELGIAYPRGRNILAILSKANRPRTSIAFRLDIQLISSRRYGKQFVISPSVGLLSGGTHFTAAVT